MNTLTRLPILFVLTILTVLTVHLPMSSALQTVAIIGGGISGLSCAQHLAKTNKFVPTVFDTGRLRPGGRCSSRQPEDSPASTFDHCVVDHATQIIRVPPSYTEFKSQVETWLSDGVLASFPPNSIQSITAQSKVAQPIADMEAYYGIGGMQSIPLSLSSGINVVQDCWVSPSNGVKLKGGKWVVKSKGEELGSFDKLVIAHNGKCADRLMSKTPAKELHNLLRVNFADRVSKSGGKRMTLNR
ncbi:hypothetical protein TL16_g08401 [Triparma laevis f. inornata]|uniref:FAD dependent oxidoreductase domain-containing protein n=1 Tax=Triparma laevis f. inornata TaxID=1714386 RepID=A0A9W7AW49_9STRA|nr:hypothetical protein TL16_g08401 [Triparma laevis f. inornata]